jgi:hypothetical protein
MSKTFRDLYLQDWTVTRHQDTRDLYDVNGTYRQVAVGEPKIEMEFRGHPVTVTEQPQGKKRIAIWMPGEAMRTRPLLEQLFDGDDYHRLSITAAQNASVQSQMFGSKGPLGPTEAFMVEWCQENYNRILKEEDRRSMYGIGWTDMGQWSDPVPPLPVSSFRGEDGNRYVAIDTEKLRKQQAAEKRRQRQQDELEAIPGFASF